MNVCRYSWHIEKQDKIVTLNIILQKKKDLTKKEYYIYRIETKLLLQENEREYLKNKIKEKILSDCN